MAHAQLMTVAAFRPNSCDEIARVDSTMTMLLA
jgi:hypothetical protein